MLLVEVALDRGAPVRPQSGLDRGEVRVRVADASRDFDPDGTGLLGIVCPLQRGDPHLEVVVNVDHLLGRAVEDAPLLHVFESPVSVDGTPRQTPDLEGGSSDRCHANRDEIGFEHGTHRTPRLGADPVLVDGLDLEHRLNGDWLAAVEHDQSQHLEARDAEVDLLARADLLPLSAMTMPGPLRTRGSGVVC
jgi:hypothetical protein